MSLSDVETIDANVDANLILNMINTDDIIYNNDIFSNIKDDPYEVINQNGVIFEDTKEISIGGEGNYTNWSPTPTVNLISPIGRPDRTELLGTYEFNLEIDGAHTHKKKYLYSHNLNRIYVDMDTNFPVKFNWSAPQHRGDLYVRATVAFADDAQAEKRVERCYQHSHESSNAQNITMAERMNVLRSARASGDSSDVYYCGLSDQPNSWYSVVVKLRASDSHAYKFVCKNSCASGINRRATCIIFTLEDVLGNVMGRANVGVRVCSCPRRDMESDQKRESSKRRAPATPNEVRPTIKKSRVAASNTSEDVVVQLPSFKIVGVETTVAGLNVMLAMMRQTLAHRQASQQPVEELHLSITSIQSFIEELEK